MLRLSFMALCATAALASACGSSGATADAGTDLGSTTDRGPGNNIPDAPDVTITHTLRPVTGHVTLQEMSPIAGATVEVVGAAPAMSTTTNAMGEWTLSLTTNEYALLRSSKATFRSIQDYVLIPQVQSDISLRLVPNDQIAGLFMALHITEATTAGILIMHFRPAVGTTQVPGFGATFSTPGGTSFILAGGMMPTAGSVTLAGDNTLGIANMPAGMVTVTPVPPHGMSCVPRAGTATARVDPQVMTNLDFDCS